MQRIAVIGAGLMGHGIALEFAAAGRDVMLQDTADDLLSAAIGRINAAAALMAGAGLLTQAQVAEIPRRIATTTSLAEAGADADVVVEAVYEDLALKQAIFQELDTHCPPHTILASNSSSFMSSKLAAVTRRPAQVLIAHYFNPPHLMPLVELVRHPGTSQESVDAMFTLCTEIGKRPVVIEHELPGFVANRLQMAIWREAQHIVAQGVCSERDLDTVVRFGFGRRYAASGPFSLGALISPEVRRAVAAEIMPDLANGIPTTDRGAFTLADNEREDVRQQVARTLLALARWDAGAGNETR